MPTKAKEFLNEQLAQDRDCYIVVRDGEVQAVLDYVTTETIGKIGSVKLSIEEPDNTPGVYRVESSMILDEDENDLHDDQEIVDNQEYHDSLELVEDVAKKYGISTDLIEES